MKHSNDNHAWRVGHSLLLAFGCSALLWTLAACAGVGLVAWFGR